MFELQDEEVNRENKHSFEQSEEESFEHEYLPEDEERWDALVMNAFDAESHLDSIFDEGEEDNGDHKHSCMKVEEEVVAHKFVPPPFWKEKNWFGDEECCQNYSVKPVFVMDVVDEDPHLEGLFDEEEKVDEEVFDDPKLVREQDPPLVEPKPPDLKLGEESHVEEENKTGIGVPKKDEPCVEKKHKVRKKRSSSQGSRKKEEELVLDDVAKPYVVPQRRFKDMKKEVNRKDIIK